MNLDIWLRFLSKMLKAWPDFSLLFILKHKGKRKIEGEIVKQKKESEQEDLGTSQPIYIVKNETA